MTEYAVNHEYELALRELKAKYLERSAKVMATQPALTPALEARLQLAFGGANAPYRALTYLWQNQGCRTDEISLSCGVGNVSDAFRNPRYLPTLHSLGLVVSCEVEQARNRFGDRTIIGRWWLSFDDLSKLYGEAANDAVELVKKA